MTDIVSLQRTLYTSRNPTRRWLHTSRRDLVTNAIRTAPIDSHDRAIEVGPGSGVYIPTLCQMFKSVVAIDVEQAHIDALRKLPEDHSNLQLLTTDLCEEHWRERFDLVLCSEVIEHVHNPRQFMGGLANATRSGGVLVLSTPQPWSLIEVTASVALSRPLIGLVRLVYREPVLPTGHISVQSSMQIKTLLKEHDFEILTSSYFGLYIPLIAEFGGELAVKAFNRIQSTVQRIGPQWILWTQMHTARKR